MLSADKLVGYIVHKRAKNSLKSRTKMNTLFNINSGNKNLEQPLLTRKGLSTLKYIQIKFIEFLLSISVTGFIPEMVFNYFPNDPAALSTWRRKSNNITAQIMIKSMVVPTKLYVRRNENKVNSIETGRTVIVHLFPWSDQENCSTSGFSNYW